MGNENISVKDLRSTPVVVGVDAGSTTVKAIVPDPDKLEILWSDDPRHNTKQPEKVHELLTAIEASFPNSPHKVASAAANLVYAIGPMMTKTNAERLQERINGTLGSAPEAIQNIPTSKPKREQERQ